MPLPPGSGFLVVTCTAVVGSIFPCLRGWILRVEHSSALSFLHCAPKEVMAHATRSEWINGTTTESIKTSQYCTEGTLLRSPPAPHANLILSPLSTHGSRPTSSFPLDADWRGLPVSLFVRSKGGESFVHPRIVLKTKDAITGSAGHVSPCSPLGVPLRYFPRMDAGNARENF